MAAAFPWDGKPRLQDWLVSSRLGTIKAAVEAAVDDDGGHPPVDEIAQPLRRMPITLGERSYLVEPWHRSMVAGADRALMSQGLHPGDRYTHSYDVYHLAVDAGAEMVTKGTNGGPVIDPMFVFVEGSTIVVRAADDRHRDELISGVEDHIGRANGLVAEWNDHILPAAIEREIDRVVKSRQRALARSEAREAAGFKPAAPAAVRPVPLPDTRYAAPPKSPRSTPTDAPRGLTPEQFDAILDCVATHREQVETYPGAGAPAAAGEDDHRDRVLLSLNMRFRDATGESFSKKGKTDIRLLVEDHAYFYAECKIWRSVTSITEALEQLSDRYLTNRDQYGALIMFVRGEPHPRPLVDRAVYHLAARHDAKHLADIHHFPMVRSN